METVYRNPDLAPAAFTQALNAISEARTALDDPTAIDPESELFRECAETSDVLDRVYGEAAPPVLTLYAVAMLDEALAILNPEEG